MARKGKNKKVQERKNEQRPVRFRRYKYLFLIVCEDQNTEPAYFRQFKSQIPKDTLYLREIGTGLDPKGVIDFAIIEKNKLSVESRKDVDAVWAVFDKDDADKNDTTIKRFNDAFDNAKSNNIQIAYSNEVFELWLLLHLTDVDMKVALPRQNIYGLLEEHIIKNTAYSTWKYQHGNADILKIIQEVGNQNNAINRAKILFTFHEGKAPIEANPSTKMHILVNELLDWIAYYS
jgi:hypothetical protein